MLPGTLYWLGICAFVGICIYAALTRCDPLGEARHDAPDNHVGGDWPFILGDLKCSRFHSERK